MKSPTLNVNYPEMKGYNTEFSPITYPHAIYVKISYQVATKTQRIDMSFTPSQNLPLEGGGQVGDGNIMCPSLRKVSKE